jgi:hypothetical protein
MAIMVRALHPIAQLQLIPKGPEVGVLDHRAGQMRKSTEAQQTASRLRIFSRPQSVEVAPHSIDLPLPRSHLEAQRGWLTRQGDLELGTPYRILRKAPLNKAPSHEGTK